MNTVELSKMPLYQLEWYAIDNKIRFIIEDGKISIFQPSSQHRKKPVFFYIEVLGVFGKRENGQFLFYSDRGWQPLECLPEVWNYLQKLSHEDSLQNEIMVLPDRIVRQYIPLSYK